MLVNTAVTRIEVTQPTLNHQVPTIISVADPAKGTRPLFQTKLGPKDRDRDWDPPYLRVWMTAPPSPYLQVWFWPFSHCMDRSSDVKRIWEEQCFASCLGRLILSVNLSIYKYDFYSSISPSRQVVPFLTCTLNEQVVEHLPDRPICPSTRVKTATALIPDYVRRANFTTKSRL